MSANVTKIRIYYFNSLRIPSSYQKLYYFLINSEPLHGNGGCYQAKAKTNFYEVLLCSSYHRQVRKATKIIQLNNKVFTNQTITFTKSVIINKNMCIPPLFYTFTNYTNNMKADKVHLY